MSLRLLLILMVSIFSQHAQSNTFNLQGTSISAVALDGYCEVVGGQAADALILSIAKKSIGPENKILMVFVACKELEDIRNGGKVTLENYGTFMAPTSRGEIRKLSGATRLEFIKLAGEGMIISNLNEAIKKSELQFKQKSIHVENLGLLDSDANGLYIGVVATYANGAGPIQTNVIVAGATLVKEYAISINISQRYMSQHDLRLLLALQKSLMADFVQSNK